MPPENTPDGGSKASAARGHKPAEPGTLNSGGLTDFSECLLVEVDRLANDLQRLRAILEVLDHHRLLLEHLVVLEKAADLGHPMRGKIGKALVMRVLRV